jgi:propanediol utilization protein
MKEFLEAAKREVARVKELRQTGEFVANQT